MTQEQYAEHIGRSQQYVSTMIKKGIISVGRDGSIDPDIADRQRAANTSLFRGEVRHRRRQARQGGTPQPQQAAGQRSYEPSVQFCDVCQQAHWITPLAICETCGCQFGPKYVAESKGGGDPWRFCSRECAGLAPIKPRRFVCQQCGDPHGYTLAEAETLDSPDPSRFCDRDCEYDNRVGKTQAQTRRRVALHLLEDTYTEKELKDDGYGGWL